MYKVKGQISESDLIHLINVHLNTYVEYVLQYVVFKWLCQM